MKAHSLLLLVLYICHTIANTESAVFKVPGYLQADSPSILYNNEPTISLEGTNRALKKFDVPPSSNVKIELHGLHSGDTYHAKVCWTAIDPIEISNISYVILGNRRKDTTEGNVGLRSFITFDVSSKSYPPIAADTVPINVSIAAVRLGIPVDLYATIIFIALLVGGMYVFNRQYDIYSLLKKA